jgi:hypothetical protein
VVKKISIGFGFKKYMFFVNVKPEHLRSVPTAACSCPYDVSPVPNKPWKQAATINSLMLLKMGCTPCLSSFWDPRVPRDKTILKSAGKTRSEGTTDFGPDQPGLVLLVDNCQCTLIHPLSTQCLKG